MIAVTTLAAGGAGSLREALEATGPRKVVFAVAGVIDLDLKSLRVSSPHLTIAGETAPSPGVTLIRGGLVIRTHDVIIRHLRVRPGDAGQPKGGGWECDAISVDRGRDVVVDHCSCAWATDENLSASGPRFEGEGPQAWRAATSHRVVITNNIVAEGLSHATHAKGEHSKGGLIHDNVTEVEIRGNLYAHNRERSPLFKGGARGVVANNLIYDPGRRAMAFNLHAGEWAGRGYETGQMAVVGNVVRAGPSSPEDLAILSVGGEGPLDLFAADNLGFDRRGRSLPLIGRHGEPAIKPGALARPPGLTWTPAAAVEAAVLRDAGARPWDRDATDRRIIAQVRARSGRVIDSQDEVGGYRASGT